MTSAHEDDRTAGELLTPGEVAELLRVDARTVTRWAKTGKLPAAVRTPGGHRRYRRGDLAPYLAGEMPEAVGL